MAAPLLHPAKKLYAYSEYLELEKETGIRYEYWNGQVFAMAGGSTAHNEIAINCVVALRQRFAGRGCRVFIENVKQELVANEHYVYPDVIVTCDPRDKRAKYNIKYPSILIEVLSSSTEEYDRTEKWRRYKRLPSLRHYLLVSQKECVVELFSRSASDALFVHLDFVGLDAVVEPPNADFSISMREIYQDIVLADDADDEEPTN